MENNGTVGSRYTHNFYNAAEPIIVQYCYIGGLKAGADGQNFKDRGSGTAGGAFTAYVYRLVGDINQDRSVDVVDLLTLAAGWGTASGEAGYDAASDLNGDDSIDVVDLLILAERWGTSVAEGDVVL